MPSKLARRPWLRGIVCAVPIVLVAAGCSTRRAARHLTTCRFRLRWGFDETKQDSHRPSQTQPIPAVGSSCRS